MLFTAMFLQICILANPHFSKSTLQQIHTSAICVPALLHSIETRLFLPQVTLLVPHPYQIHMDAHIQSKSQAVLLKWTMQ